MDAAPRNDEEEGGEAPVFSAPFRYLVSPRYLSEVPGPVRRNPQSEKGNTGEKGARPPRAASRCDGRITEQREWHTAARSRACLQQYAMKRYVGEEERARRAVRYPLCEPWTRAQGAGGWASAVV